MPIARCSCTEDVAEAAARVKNILAESDYSEAKEMLDQANNALESAKNVLSVALFPKNGKLSTGSIDYAAFRVETLSKIFEVARRNFVSRSGSGAKWYDDFLNDLGDEVGFTFARDLLNRLNSNRLFRNVLAIEELLELWALFENDTGAGKNTLGYGYDEDGSIVEVAVHLENNPLRRVESEPHSHCGFYLSYIKALLNELLTSRSRILQDEIGQPIRYEALKVIKILEQPDAKDNCVYIATLRKEVNEYAFDLMTQAFDSYYAKKGVDDYSECVIKARGALKKAQEQAAGFEDNPPTLLYKAFKSVLTSPDFKRMDVVYQRASQPLHPEKDPKRTLTRQDCWAIMTDIRRSVYTLEFIELTEEKKVDIQTTAYLLDIERSVRTSSRLNKEGKEQAKKIFKEIQEGKIKDERTQERLIRMLQTVGGKTWEMTKPIITGVITAAVKKQFGL
ncbi:MAG: hypothetical protein KJ621_14070 [Proteobacteria bacterium]|nr:hypothetical protein [Pseudomonadota bacterium]MBU1741206.1 hypothetical protein [Pseudomonadota bacterium]